MSGVSAGARALQAATLLAFLVLALYFPYWWFGVVPFATDTVVPQSEIDRLLAGRNMPDYYAVELPEISDEEFAAQKAAFTWCRFCHTLEQGGENRVGPNLWGIVGKNQATVAGFSYSADLQGLEQTLVEIGYFDPLAPKLLRRRLRRIFNRVEPDRSELNILRGILGAAQRAARGDV